MVDYHVGELAVIDDQEDEGETQSNIKNISMSLEPSTFALVRYESSLHIYREHLFGRD